jgi:hypothetical protein
MGFSIYIYIYIYSQKSKLIAISVERNVFKPELLVYLNTFPVLEVNNEIYAGTSLRVFDILDRYMNEIASLRYS